MTIKTLETGSKGNCYILTANSGKQLIIDAGIPIAEIKRGLDFDVENVVGAIVTHCHKDHSLSVSKLRTMGIPVWTPYTSDFVRQKTRLGEFDIECFDVPHNGTPCRAFIIKVEGTTILYCTDYEYIPYRLDKKQINVMLIEMNYQIDRIADMDSHRQHTVLGHAEERTTIDVIAKNIKHLRKVILCHMSKSGSLDRELAMKHIREVVPDYIEVVWAKENTTEDISECPF